MIYSLYFGLSLSFKDVLPRFGLEGQAGPIYWITFQPYKFHDIFEVPVCWLIKLLANMITCSWIQQYMYNACINMYSFMNSTDYFCVKDPKNLKIKEALWGASWRKKKSGIRCIWLLFCQVQYSISLTLKYSICLFVLKRAKRNKG